MFVTKKVSDLVIGDHYLAFSAKSKMLSSNGGCGVLIKVLNVGNKDVQVKPLHAPDAKAFSLRNLDTRDDAWVVDISEDMTFRCSTTERQDAWPRLFPKQMIGGLKIGGVAERELPDGDTVSYVVGNKDDLERPYIYRTEWISCETNIADVLIPWQREAEERAKKLEEMRKKAEAALAERKAEGVQLMRGKQDDGQLKMLAWLMPSYYEVGKSDHNNNGYTASMSRWWVESKEHMFTDAYEREDSDNHACHAGMRGTFNRPKKLKNPNYCPAVWTSFQRDKVKRQDVKKEHALAWINYIVNESGFAKLHLIKDPETVYKYGFMVDARFPSRLVMAATACTRQAWEQPHKAMAFGSLLDNHVNPHIAWLVCQAASGDYKCGFKFTNLVGGHTFVEHNMVDEAILNLLRGEPQVKYSDYCDEQLYSGTNEQWLKESVYGTSQSRGNTPVGTIFKELCKGSSKATGFNVGKAKPISQMAVEIQQAGELWADKMGIDLVTLEKKDA